MNIRVSYATHRRRQAFTLIELSIVLVIIGLIVGGVLVGRDLIKTAQLRQIISKVEKYKTAVATFKTKYDGMLPGDLLTKDAARFGLWSGCTTSSCGPNVGDPGAHYMANNDGIIWPGNNQGQTIGGGCGGECAMFWRHLGEARLIEGSYGSDIDSNGNPTTVDGSGNFVLSKYQPATPIENTYFAVASMYFDPSYGFGNNLRAPDLLIFYFLKQGTASSSPYVASMTPYDTAAMDAKIDDGKPGTGNLLISSGSGNSTFYLSNAPTSGYCASGVTNPYQANQYAGAVYNTSAATGGNDVSCLPIFVIQ